MTIEEFIEARTGELEKAANEAVELEEMSAIDGYGFEYRWARFRTRNGKAQASYTFEPGSPTPDEVLRQCNANRALLEQYASAKRRFPDPPTGDEPYSRSGIEAMAQFDFLRALIRYTAAIWSDHPDYRQEWKL